MLGDATAVVHAVGGSAPGAGSGAARRVNDGGRGIRGNSLSQGGRTDDGVEPVWGG